MGEDGAVLSRVRLFQGMSREERERLLSCLRPAVWEGKRDAFVLRAGERPGSIGIVLGGRLLITRVSAEGERVILAGLGEGECFAEALCCAGAAQSPVSVQADTDARVMLLPYAGILRGGGCACGLHSRLLENLLALLAEKSLALQSRMETLGRKGLRERLLHYLESQSPGPGEPFTIPFTREEMADYLCVNRSALSRELGRLRAEGVLDFWRDAFRLRP